MPSPTARSCAGRLFPRQDPNLFRCAAASAAACDTVQCPGPSCLSCRSFTADRGRDLAFEPAGANLSLECQTVVAWDVTRGLREAAEACGVSRAGNRAAGPLGGASGRGGARSSRDGCGGRRTHQI
jgi:hypothetical protein